MVAMAVMIVVAMAVVTIEELSSRPVNNAAACRQHGIWIGS